MGQGCERLGSRVKCISIKWQIINSAWRQWGCQAVVAQTAFSAVIAMDLLQHGTWQGVGVLGPEAFEPDPFMDKMEDYGFPYGIKEMTKETAA